MIERFSFGHALPLHAIELFQVLYSVEQSCNNTTFQLCTKGEGFPFEVVL